MANRKQIEDRILQIISYIDQENMLTPLIWSIKLFSLEELLQLLKFLETWDYKPIYTLVDQKIKEYIIITKEIKQIKIKNKIYCIKQEELNELENEEQNLDKLLLAI
jgi:predicted patatin/cPLA2 family phospholipase